MARKFGKVRYFLWFFKTKYNENVVFDIDRVVFREKYKYTIFYLRSYLKFALNCVIDYNYIIGGCIINLVVFILI